MGNLFKTVLCFIVVLGLLPTALAHDDPAHKIRGLTVKIAEQGASARLHLLRALAYRDFGRDDLALRDLDTVLGFEGTHEQAVVQRCRVLWALGRGSDALDAARQGMCVVQGERSKNALLLIQAEILTETANYSAASKALDAALCLAPDALNVHLHRSLLRGLLGQRERRCRELRVVFARIKSPIIGGELVDACLALGDSTTALPIIDEELALLRWRSAWLIRRARVRMIEKQPALAQADLMEALRELSGRINPAKPDLLLVADRTLALHLLGRRAAAARSREVLRVGRYPLLLARGLDLILDPKHLSPEH